jgi:P-type conjugative transfer protein TrbJ
MLQKKWALSLIVILFIFANSSIYAGMPVIDMANLNQNIMNYIDQIKNTIQTYKMLQNHMTQLQNEALNLQNMNASAAGRTVSNIQGNLVEMIRCYEQTKGMVANYSNIQSQWDRTYKNFDQWNGMSATDYANHARDVQDMTSKTIYDSMRTAGLVAQIGDDHANLQNLLYATRTSQGALAAAQTGNQIMGMMVEQMFRLEEIMSAGFRAQGAYYQQMLESQKANQSMNESQDFNEPDTLSGKGNGPGLDGDFK